MRQQKGADLIRLARALAGTAEGLTLDEMAGTLDVNRRTAERMRDALSDLFPLEERRDGRAKRFRIRDRLDGFLQAPSAEELSDLEATIRALEASGGGARSAQLRSLQTKIVGALRPDVKRRIAPDLEALLESQTFALQAGPRPLADGRVLAQLREAILSVRMVRFDYHASGRRTERLVAPYGLLYGKAWYLVGPQDGWGDPVLWRLDRIGRLSLDAPYPGAPSEFNLAEYALRSFATFQEEPEEVVLRFSPSAAPDARRFLFHPTQVMEDRESGSLEVRFCAGGLLELVRHLFTWGDTVEIIAPDRLREMMVAELRSALCRHSGSGSGGASSADRSVLDAPNGSE